MVPHVNVVDVTNSIPVTAIKQQETACVNQVTMVTRVTACRELISVMPLTPFVDYQLQPVTAGISTIDVDWDVRVK
jgi:hypothetical protein